MTGPGTHMLRARCPERASCPGPWPCAAGWQAFTEGAEWRRACQRKAAAEQHRRVRAEALGDVRVPPMRLAVLVRPEESREVGGGHGARGRRQRARRVRKATQAATQPRRAVRTAPAAAHAHAAAAATATTNATTTAAAAAAAGAAGAAAGAAHLSLVDRMGQVIGAELHRGVLAIPRAKPRRHEGACGGAQRARRPHGGAARLLQP